MVINQKLSKPILFPLLGLLMLAPGIPGVRANAEQGVTFDTDRSGLRALRYGTASLALDPGGRTPGEASPPTFTRRDGTTYQAASEPPAITAVGHSVTASYRWGSIHADYSSAKNRLLVRLIVHNRTQDKLTGLTVHVLTLSFPRPVQTTELDAGQFGMGGKPRSLDDYPASADPQAAPPIVYLTSSVSSAAFSSEEVTAPLTVVVSSTGATKESGNYAFETRWAGVPAGGSVAHSVSFRFGPAAAAQSSLAGDIIRKYAAAFPLQLRWRDRRPIGTLFLASVGPHPPHNPRGWFNNAPDVDVTTPAGLEQFRKRLLEYADTSVKILREMNAQGMITWDPEGEEFNNSVYYGDPRLTSRLAPETAYRGGTALGCMDEFFKRFLDAGFRVGVCIRPQEIAFLDGRPDQKTSPDAVRTLKSKIGYASRRWGCSLFYTDSTVDEHGAALNADVFRRAADAFPHVLLMPENETLRDYAYSAPLNSFQHHKVTSTPPGALEVYPRAFSVLLAGEGDIARYHAPLVAAVRRGDILLFHGWWNNPDNPLIKEIYDEAYGRSKPAR